MSRRVAVTGSTGFIGTHLVEHLSARGDQVVAVRRPFTHPGIADALHGADAVVHLAGVVSTLHERDYVAANVDNTRLVAAAARDTGARLVHISSLAAGGPASAAAPRSEDDEPMPVTPYGRSKLASEEVLRSMPGLAWIALRPGVVYGPRDRALLPIFQIARRGLLPLVGRADAAYTMIHVTDAVRAITAAIDSSMTGEAIFVGHAPPATGRDILEAVRSAVSGSARIVRVPMAVTRVAALAGDLAGALRGKPLPINASRYIELAAEGFVCRVDRMRERLGVVAEIDLRDGLAATAAWYTRERWL